MELAELRENLKRLSKQEEELKAIIWAAMEPRLGEGRLELVAEHEGLSYTTEIVERQQERTVGVAEARNILGSLADDIIKPVTQRVIGTIKVGKARVSKDRRLF